MGSVGKRHVVAVLVGFGGLFAGCAVRSTPVASKSTTTVASSTSTRPASTTIAAAPRASTTTAKPRPPTPPPDGIPKPDPRLTPGATFPVTAAQVCVSGYSSSVRSVSDAENKAVYAEYGIASHAPYSYEVDHLISLELGGSNDIRNLWPEAYAGVGGAHAKDAIENELHAQVCSGGISLATAQAEIVRWWTLPGAESSSGGSTPATAPRLSPPTSAHRPYVYPGAFCSPLAATGYTVAGTRMVCSDHSATGTPYKGGTLHWRAA
jgi:hypothetical protein